MPKKLIILVAAIIVVGLGIGLPLVFLLGGVDLSSPEATVNSLLDAVEDQDAGRMADCVHFPATYYYYWTFEDRDELIEFWDDWFEDVDSIRFSDIDIDVDYTDTDEATVHVTYHVVADYTEASGFPDYEGDDDEYYDLVKIDDSWYITEVY